MKNNKGFSIVELIIAMTIIAAVFSIGITIFTTIKKRSQNNNLSRGYNGTTETRCIDDFKFIIGRNGNVQQILNEQGHGIRCDN